MSILYICFRTFHQHKSHTWSLTLPIYRSVFGPISLSFVNLWPICWCQNFFFLQHFVNKLPSNKIFKIYLTHRDLHLQIATGVSTLSSLSGRSAVTIDVPPDSSRFFGRKSSILHVVPVSHDITESAWSTFDVNRFFTPCNLCSFSLVKLYCRFYGIYLWCGAAGFRRLGWLWDLKQSEAIEWDRFEIEVNSEVSCSEQGFSAHDAIRANRLSAVHSGRVSPLLL